MVLVKDESLPPWLRFEGRWGEYFVDCGINCGPTGPNRKEAWSNPLGGAALFRQAEVGQGAGSLAAIPWDDQLGDYVAQFHARLTPCAGHTLVVHDDLGQRLSPVENTIDPKGRAAEYLRNCGPEGANRHTVLIHDPEIVPARLDIIPDPLLARAAGTVSLQQRVPMTLEVSVPYPDLNVVRQSVYTNLTWPITATGYITLTAGGDLTLYVDMDGDGVIDTTVTPTVTEQSLDFTPPGQVYDLAARVVSTGTVELTWTAPGDDLMAGRASLYEIRYYTEPITLLNWPEAWAVLTNTEPITAGLVQTLRVEDVPTGEWYFALRAVDEAGNAGLVSNSSGVTVVGYPLGDIDRNCVVGERDIAVVAQTWRKLAQDEGWNARWDVWKDGVIDVLDVLQVAKQWGKRCP